jgi:hypothetical protein
MLMAVKELVQVEYQPAVAVMAGLAICLQAVDNKQCY